MATAENIGRINVWPTYDAAREADTAECKFIGRLTVWRTNAEARANLTSGGGGTEPDWVPEGAVIHIDFVGGDPQGRAWVAGTGEVAVDTLLGSDPNSENYQGASAYNPANLTADGYTNGGIVALIGAARDKATDDAGVTVVCRYMSPVQEGSFYLLIHDPDGEVVTSVECVGSTGDFNASGSDSAYVEILAVLNFGEGAINVMAMTVTPSRLETAVNGSAPVTSTMTIDDWPVPNVFSVCVFDSNKPVQSITLYDPLPSTAGLSELSEVA